MCLYCVERKMSRFKNRKEDGGVVLALEKDNRLRSCKERRRRRRAGDLLDPCLVGGALKSRLHRQAGEAEIWNQEGKLCRNYMSGSDSSLLGSSAAKMRQRHFEPVQSRQKKKSSQKYLVQSLRKSQARSQSFKRMRSQHLPSTNP